jgi:hypothetical protein
VDFWRREKPAFIQTAAKYAKANAPGTDYNQN